MGSFALLVSSVIFMIFFHRGTGLRCRVSNQQTDDQFKKILHVCRQRNSGREDEDDDRSSDDSEDSDNSSTSIEDVFDKRLFFKKNNNNNRYSFTTAYGDWNNDRNSQSSNDKNDRSRQYNRTYGYSGGDLQDRNMGNYRGSANQGNRRRMSNAGAYNNNYNNNGQEQACTIQCFFNELNVVDHRGFPERRAVTNLMTQNVQDPEFKDFIEESIIECFHYLDSNPHKEKCRFSQTFLACLAEKGKERCEDWE